MPLDDYVTIDDIIGKVRVTSRTVRNQAKRWAREGKAEKISGVWFIDKQTAENFIATHRK